MDKNELMIKESHSLLLPKQTKEEPIYAVVKYERVDSAHYSFTYSFNEDFSFRMDETDHAEEKTDYVDEEFEEHVSESAKVYYSMAAASGILTGTLSMLHLSEEQLAGIEEFKEKNWKPLIVSCANLAGYKKSDYKGAAKYLFNRSARWKSEGSAFCLVKSSIAHRNGFLHCNSVLWEGGCSQREWQDYLSETAGVLYYRGYKCRKTSLCITLLVVLPGCR